MCAWQSLLSLVGGIAVLASPAHAFGEPPTTLPASQLELARVVDLAAERLHLTIEYEAAALKGSVTLRVAEALTDRELWDLTNRVLASRGFTTVQPPGTSGMSVVRLAEAKNIAAVVDESNAPAHSHVGTPDGVPPRPATYAPGFSSVLIRLQHRAPKEVVDTVKLVLTKDAGGISVLGDTGLVIISDVASRLAQARAILATLDTPASTAVEEVETRYLTPAQLAPLVTEVAGKCALSGGEAVKGEVVPSPSGRALLIIAPPDRVAAWRELIERLDRREPVSTTTYSPRRFSAGEVARLVEQSIREGPVDSAADDRFRVVTDELTSSIIVTATPAQHDRIQALVQRLDAAGEASPRPLRTFAIRNRPVADVQGVIEQLLDAGAFDAPVEPNTAALQRSSPEASTSVETTPRPPDSARRTPRRATTFPLAAQADGLDRIEADGLPLSLTSDPGTNTLIAIGEPRALSQLEALLATIDVRQPQVMLEVMLVSLTEAQGLQLGVEIEKLTNIDSTVIRLASLFGLSSGAAAGRLVGDAAGFTGTALNPGDFNLVVRALQNMNHGRSLSAPQVLVANNQQAVLSSVLQQPFASTNASSTVATTSFGGTQDAGTTLSIRPQIAEGDHLVLQYSVALSSFVGTSGGSTLPPPRQQNTVQSTVTIPDGFTVVVGGLELETESKSVSQVPLLGDVPLVGELFKNRDTARSRTRFFVFIRAGVLRSRSFEDLRYVSEVRAEDMGVGDGFPEVKPRVIR